MRLPSLLVLTDRRQCPGPLEATVAAAVAGGARAVVLREKDLPPEERFELARRLLPALESVGGLLLMAGSGIHHGSGTSTGTSTATSAGPSSGRARSPWSGVHLAAHEAMPDVRPEVVGQSCHTVEEIAAAGRAGCDYVTASPVFSSRSKPGYGPPLGLPGLAGLARVARTHGLPPIYALGGVDLTNAADCLRAGASGVAIMGALMRSDNPRAWVAAVLQDLTADDESAARPHLGSRTSGERAADDGGMVPRWTSTN